MMVSSYWQSLFLSTQTWLAAYPFFQLALQSLTESIWKLITIIFLCIAFELSMHLSPSLPFSFPLSGIQRKAILCLFYISHVTGCLCVALRTHKQYFGLNGHVDFPCSHKSSLNLCAGLGLDDRDCMWAQRKSNRQVIFKRMDGNFKQFPGMLTVNTIR